MTTHAEEYWREPRGLLTLWAGVLLGPIGWAINLQTNYTLSVFACDGAWPLVLHAVTIASLAIAGAGIWLGWRSWQALGGAGYAAGEAEPNDRLAPSRFMAASGCDLSAFFAIAIVAQWIPMFFQDPCRY